MSRQKTFGGEWTQDKLERLRGYLEAYMRIFKNQPWAQTVYVDAFAGTGTIQTKSPVAGSDSLAESAEQEMQRFLEGSARIALTVEPPFSNYLFIEQSV